MTAPAPVACTLHVQYGVDSRALVSRAPGNPGHFSVPEFPGMKTANSRRNREQLTAVTGPADQHCACAIQQVDLTAAR